VFERIVGMRKKNDGSFRYRVRWYGYNRNDDTWDPSSFTRGCSASLSPSGGASLYQLAGNKRLIATYTYR
jgi:hypothetical protein